MSRRHYLQPRESVKGLSLKRQPTDEFPSYTAKGHWVICPHCNGYGGWNLAVDAYGEGKHFNAACAQCNGWGWVDDIDPRDVNCQHEYHEKDSRFRELMGYPRGNCEHVWVCRKCDKWQYIDSSG